MRTGLSVRLEAMAWRAVLPATGLMLLRVVDPEFKTSDESAAASAALVIQVASIYYAFMPAFAFAASK